MVKKDKKKSQTQVLDSLFQQMTNIQVDRYVAGFNLSIAQKIMVWSKKQKIPQDEFFASMEDRIEGLFDIVGRQYENTPNGLVDASAIYAAMLYPYFVPEKHKRFSYDRLDELDNIFRGDDGIVSAHVKDVRALIENTIQVRACDLVALPHPIRTADDAFKDPQGKESENLNAFFILLHNTVHDKRAWALRGLEWYLKLCAIEDRTQDYSEEERLKTYYYTDKVYAPFCEYMALQQLRDNPHYNPNAEEYGFYRLKIKMDEKLLRQIDARAHQAIMVELDAILKGFPIDGHGLYQRYHFLSQKIECEIRDKITAPLGLADEAVRFEVRLKKPSSIHKKYMQGDKKSEDFFALRIILDNTRIDEHTEALCGRIYGKMFSRFGGNKGRKKDFYSKPRPNGYRAFHGSFTIFGREMEVQIVDSKSHVNNSIGTASHVFYKMGKRARESLMKQFQDSASESTKRLVVVRVQRDLDNDRRCDFVVMQEGDTIQDLANKIHPDVGQGAGGAVVNNYDPLNFHYKEQVDLKEPLRDGMVVMIQPKASLKLT